jgi:hypothetical protein
MPPQRSPATWIEAARILYAINPALYNTEALGRIFRRSGAQAWIAVNPECRRYTLEKRKDKIKEAQKRWRQSEKGKATRRANQQRYRARRKQRENKGL